MQLTGLTQELKKLTIEQMIEWYALGESIVETINEPILVLDEQFKIKMVNHALCETFHVAPKQCLNKAFFSFHSGIWKSEELKTSLESVLQKNSVIQGMAITLQMSKKDKRFYQLEASRVQLENNKIKLIVVVLNDITDQKKAEEEKDNYVSIIAHELKNPLTTIDAYAQILHKMFEGGKSDKALEYIQRIEDQTHRINSLIAGLLNSAKIRAHQFEYKDQLFDFDTLVFSTIEDLQLTTKMHELLVKGKTHKKVFADQERIAQVLINLVLNAVRYSPNADKVVIALSSDKDFVKVRVRDFGIGISKANKARIFQQYFQVDQKIGSSYSNIGLGLDITANIIRHYGGQIKVTSTEGKGSSFHFTIPVKK